MSYVVLARKYRPQSFQDLVGQEHVATTLGNAIDRGRVAHAFLLTGVRGVGKTTSARLLAKCLNCLGANGENTGPVKVPCQVCNACVEITRGGDLDVQEIDGASYNGVDEVRRLQEGVNFRPARDRYKIYIVDEVHMLSSAAWNAFLKTLEEPPPHVKFIFATTEVQKVPVTILSRCQRYDFKLISAHIIGQRLREVLGQEAISFDEGAIAILAREAAGSMRDAMSLLDQVIAFSPDFVAGTEVARVLGVADRSILFDLTRALLGGTPAACIQVCADLKEQGFDTLHVARAFLGHLRDIVAVKVLESDPGKASDRSLVDLPEGELVDAKEIAASASLDDLLRVYHAFSRSFDDITRSADPHASFEMTLVRLARRPPLLPLDELLSRLGDLERRLGGSSGGPGGAAPAGGGAVSAGPRARSSGQSSAQNAAPQTGSVASAMHASSIQFTAPTQSFSQPTATRAESGRPSHLRSVPPAFEDGNAARALAFENAVGAYPEPVQRPQIQAVSLANASTIPRDAITRPVAFERPAGSATPLNERSARDGAGRERPAVVEAPVFSLDAPLPFADLADDPAVPWDVARAIAKRIDEAAPGAGSVFRHGVFLECTETRVAIGYQEGSFLGEQALDAENLAAVTAAVHAHFSDQTEVKIDLSSKVPYRIVTLAALSAREEHTRMQALRIAVQDHPMVQAARELLGASLREIRLPKDE